MRPKASWFLVTRRPAGDLMLTISPVVSWTLLTLVCGGLVKVPLSTSGSVAKAELHRIAVLPRAVPENWVVVVVDPTVTEVGVQTAFVTLSVALSAAPGSFTSVDVIGWRKPRSDRARWRWS